MKHRHSRVLSGLQSSPSDKNVPVNHCCFNTTVRTPCSFDPVCYFVQCRCCTLCGGGRGGLVTASLTFLRNRSERAKPEVYNIIIIPSLLIIIGTMGNLVINAVDCRCNNTFRRSLLCSATGSQIFPLLAVSSLIKKEPIIPGMVGILKL